MNGPFVSYQLLIELARPARVRVGALGTFDFPAGRYLYTGSARRGLEARIARHLAPAAAKRLRWHIDWLLAHPAARVLRVRRSRLPECALNRRAGGDVVAPGFGAGDCRAGCGSHLRYLGPASPSA